MVRKRTESFAETFAETVVRVAAQPLHPPSAPVGRHGDVWGGPDGTAYLLVDDDLSPEQALALAAGGASVVFDACGCGGAECELDWLSAADVRDLVARRVVPSVRRTKHGRADLAHWRSAGGRDLVVLAVDVSWGGRI